MHYPTLPWNSSASEPPPPPPPPGSWVLSSCSCSGVPQNGQCLESFLKFAPSFKKFIRCNIQNLGDRNVWKLGSQLQATTFMEPLSPFGSMNPPRACTFGYIADRMGCSFPHLANLAGICCIARMQNGKTSQELGRGGAWPFQCQAKHAHTAFQLCKVASHLSMSILWHSIHM